MSSFDLKGKKVLVVGLGKSGLAACHFLIKKKSMVSIVDQNSKKKLKPLLKKLPKKTKPILGKKIFSTSGYDLVIVSPGVPWNHPSLVQARKKNIPVWPELELGWRFVKPKKTIAITGTNGKTTTTRLVESLVKAAKKPVVVGGNIGHPLTSLTSKIRSQTLLILEVSSYQLEAHQTFHPQVGVWLNLTADHLGRHGSMKKYADIKSRLFVHMRSNEVAVLNKKDAWCVKASKKIKPIKKWFPSKNIQSLAKKTTLQGAHNRQNVMAAILAAQAVGVAKKAIEKGLAKFRGVPHRLQLIGTKRKVAYVNDSKSTNVDSTKVALKAVQEKVHLILGGRHKGTSYRTLIPYLRNVKNVYAIGEAEGLIKKDLGKVLPVSNSKNLKTAVRQAHRLVQKGEVVLLSPACASFDQYANFEDRGNHFIRLVRGLPS